ncbi:SRPBCC family protein [Pseudoxanthobacter sp. M-2]|uniref:SRPBCC family protein n=1 Tax=Pseudoxanthobacter sp. M-2 TaxID=3078754 RepID=UPI0038FBFEA0
MKKVLLGLLAVVVVAIAGVLVAAAMQPDSFRIARSLAIKAPADRIYPLIADFHRWSVWSPYETLDPAMKREIGGPPSGVGATYAWAGNGQAGAGTMRITEAAPSSRVVIDLAFTEPFEANNTALFTLAPDGDGTLVTWAMEGESSFPFKVMCLFFDADAMIGQDFEKGLANLKREAEAAAAG